MIRWNSDNINGTIDLEELRRIYRSKALSPADGKEKPVEPDRGHILRMGSDRAPVIIKSIDYRERVVNVLLLPENIAKSLFTNEAELRPGGIAIPAGVRRG